MKKYFRALLRSFHDPVQYRETLTSWNGIAGVYALFVTVVGTLGLILYLAFVLLRFQATMLPQLMDRLPEMKVAHGAVSIRNGPETPVQFDYSSGVILIDLNRSEDDFKKVPKLLMGVGRDFIVVQTKNGPKATPIDEKHEFVINRVMLKQFFSGYHLMILPIIFPFVAFGQFIYYLIRMLAVSLMSYMVTAFLREEYDFETRMRFSALALTPPTLLSLFVSFFGHQTGAWLIPLVALLYIYAMILMMRRTA